MNYKSSFEEIWEARRQIYESCHKNPKELIEYYISLQDNINLSRNKNIIKRKNKSKKLKHDLAN